MLTWLSIFLLCLFLLCRMQTSAPYPSIDTSGKPPGRGQLAPVSSVCILVASLQPSRVVIVATPQPRLGQDTQEGVGTPHVAVLQA